LPGQISHHQVERLEGLINSFWRMFVRVFDDDDEPLEYTTHELEL
jgi:hypothetical protein